MFVTIVLKHSLFLDVSVPEYDSYLKLLVVKSIGCSWLTVSHNKFI